MKFLEHHFYIDAGVTLTNIDQLNTEKKEQDFGNQSFENKEKNSEFETDNLSDSKLNSNTSEILKNNIATVSNNLEMINDSLETNIDNSADGFINSTNSEKMTVNNHENNLHQLFENLTNVTDDVKINLKSLNVKIKPSNSSSDMATELKTKSIVNKRHSSIITKEYLEKEIKKVNNRRSLNIQTRDVSRIPVSVKSYLRETKHKNEINYESNNDTENQRVNELETNDTTCYKQKIPSLKNNFKSSHIKSNNNKISNQIGNPSSSITRTSYLPISTW